VSGRILGVEVIEVILCECLLGTLPHQGGYPGDEDVADRVGVDGVNLGLFLDLVGLVGYAGLEVDVIEILAGGLEVDLGVGRVDGLGGSDGEGREAGLSGGSGGMTWKKRREIEVSLEIQRRGK